MYLIENDTNQLYKMKFLPNKKFAKEHLDKIVPLNSSLWNKVIGINLNNNKIN